MVLGFLDIIAKLNKKKLSGISRINKSSRNVSKINQHRCAVDSSRDLMKILEIPQKSFT
jgi:hypothetical protein